MHVFVIAGVPLILMEAIELVAKWYLNVQNAQMFTPDTNIYSLILEDVIKSQYPAAHSILTKYEPYSIADHYPHPPMDHNTWPFFC